MNPNRSKMLLLAGLAAACALPLAPAAAQKKSKAPAKAAAKAPVVAPKEQNKFVTVEEFARANRPLKTVVSVEGYAVTAYPSGGVTRLVLLDSVDHVLSAADANKFARGGVSVAASQAAVAKKMARIAMFTGNGIAQKKLNDTPAKMRVTGWVNGKSAIGPTVKVEAMDDNGEWKTL
jgi:hypothetical protein